MAIQFISGEPGGGKSLFSVMCILDELRLTSRNIVTNVSLNVPRVCEYLHERYGESFNASHRIKLLNETECYAFWLFYGQGLELKERRTIPVPEYFNCKKGDIDVVDYSPRGDTSVLYVIDEVHKFFGARQWAQNGQDAFYYLSEHRKFGDDVLLCSQHAGNVDKQMRSIVQDWTYLRNFNKERFGRFRSFKFLQRSTYASEQKGSGDENLCMERVRFNLDLEGVCSCYDTAAGVGIIGRTGADAGHAQRGLPPWLYFVGLATCALAVLCSLVWFERNGGKLLVRVLPNPSRLGDEYRRQKSFQGEVKTVRLPGLFAHDQGVTNSPAQSRHESSSNAYMSGMMHVGDTWYVGLSDGRTLSSDDPRMERLTADGCLYDGVYYLRGLFVRVRIQGQTNLQAHFEPNSFSTVVDGPDTKRFRWSGNLAPK